MGTIVHDLRYAARALSNAPGFAAVAILCLALGIGVNSTVYSVVDTISIRPLPFEDPAQLVRLVGVQQERGITEGATSYADFRDWLGSVSVFAGVAGYGGRNLTLSDGRDSERVIGGLVSANLFQVLGVQPILGRPFAERDDQPGAPRVVLLGHALWQRRFLSDPAVVGRVVQVNGLPYTVVGVMPPRFQFSEISQLWMPLAPEMTAATREQRNLVVYARMAPGVTIDQARADMARVAAPLAAAYPENEGWSAGAITMRDDFMPEDVVLVTTAMMGAVTLVLLIACANVANLLLARATVRNREIAVRAALGAGRWRIIRQMLAESLLLAAISAPLGLLIAYGGLRWLTASVPQDDLPYYIDWSMNWRVVIYTAAAAIVTGLLFGLAPAASLADSGMHRSLKEGGRNSGGTIRRNRLRSSLVVAEIALSLVLLVGASLFIRSVLNVQRADLGLDVRPLMTMRFFMSGEAYAEPEARERRVEEIADRVAGLPGVEAVMASNWVPLNGGGGQDAVLLPDAPVEAGRERRANFFGVTAGARRTLNVALVAGRDFQDQEGRTRSAVALINRAMAADIWPGETNVIGRQFRFPTIAPGEWFTVIGVIADFLPWNPTNETITFALIPYPYAPGPNAGLTIRVAGGALASIVPAVREQIRQADPQLPLFDVQTAEENRLATFWDTRIIGGMFTIFGGVALFLAWIGIYGVLSYAVAQRTQELGIRVALGADRRDVFRLVLGQGARLAAIGVVVGMIGAIGAARVVRSVLYNVEATDLISFAGGAGLLASAALLASYVPARRATVVDPLVALRTE
jgi:predicted permease